MVARDYKTRVHQPKGSFEYLNFCRRFFLVKRPTITKAFLYQEDISHRTGLILT